MTDSDTEPEGALELHATIARFHGLLLSTRDADEAVVQLALVARGTVASSVGAGASLFNTAGGRSSRGSTDPIAAELDRIQYELEEGPCLTAWASQTLQRIDDTASEPRWRRWAEVALQMGVRSVLSTPMSYKGRPVGAMKVYSNVAGVFTQDDERRLGHLAGAAGTLLGASAGPDDPRRISERLSASLEGRRTMALATGILMERYGLSHDDAKRRLLTSSRAHRRPVLELASEVVSGMDVRGR